MDDMNITVADIFYFLGAIAFFIFILVALGADLNVF